MINFMLKVMGYHNPLQEIEKEKCNLPYGKMVTLREQVDKVRQSSAKQFSAFSQTSFSHFSIAELEKDGWIKKSGDLNPHSSLTLQVAGLLLVRNSGKEQ